MSKNMSKNSNKSSPAPPQGDAGRAGARDSITRATSSPDPTEGKDLGRAYGCCFTLYDYQQYAGDLTDYATKARYCVLGKEVCPSTGRKHIQGYIHWENKRSLGAFSKKLGNCHVERLEGTPKQASDYCKKDGDFEEFGDLPQQGQRADWVKVVVDLKEGKQVADVIEDQPHLLPCQRAIREFKCMLLKPCHREVNVIVLVGGAGTGKTRYAYEHYPDIYSKPRGDWWDGYTGQKAILLDDYYGYLPYCELLRVLDRYPYQVPIKGGFVHAQWDTVIITSNTNPDKWYKQGMTPALRRRLNKILVVESIDGVSSYSPWIEEEEDC